MRSAMTWLADTATWAHLPFLFTRALTPAATPMVCPWLIFPFIFQRKTVIHNSLSFNLSKHSLFGRNIFANAQLLDLCLDACWWSSQVSRVFKPRVPDEDFRLSFRPTAWRIRVCISECKVLLCRESRHSASDPQWLCDACLFHSHQHPASAFSIIQRFNISVLLSNEPQEIFSRNTMPREIGPKLPKPRIYAFVTCLRSAAGTAVTV